MKEHEKAIQHFDRAIAIRRAAMDQDPRDSNMRSMMAGNFSERAVVLTAAGRRDEAIRSAREAVRLQEQSLAADPNGVPVRISMADYESRLARAYLAVSESGNQPHAMQDAATWFRRALEHWEALGREGHLRGPSIQTELAGLRADLARCEAALKPAN